MINVVLRNWPIILEGLELTATIFVSSSLIGLVLGLVVAAARMSKVAALRYLATGYVEVLRNTPLLVQVLMIYLGLPELGVRLGSLTSVILGIGLNSGAYSSEIIRGGLQSVGSGQLEAAGALGLSGFTTFVEILLPQALRVIYPALTNQLVMTVLASSIGSIIGVRELTAQILFLNSRTYQTIGLFVVLSIAYALLAQVIARIGGAFGNRLDRRYS